MKILQSIESVLQKEKPWMFSLVLFLTAFLTFVSYSFSLFHFQEKTNLFLLSYDFFIEHLRYPGGFVEYLSKVQKASYVLPWLGAVLLASELTLIVSYIASMDKKCQNVATRSLAIAVGAVLSGLLQNYQFDSVFLIGITAVVFVLSAWKRYKMVSLWYVRIVVLIASYYLFGGFVFVILAFELCSVLQRRNFVWTSSLPTLFLCLFFFLGRDILFYRSTNDLLLFPLTVGGQFEVSISYVWVLAIIGCLPLFYLLHSFSWFQRVQRVELYKITLPLHYLLLFLLPVDASKSFDSKTDQFFTLERMFFNGEYKALVEYNKHYPTNNRLGMYLVNIAKVKQNILLNEFFELSQPETGETLFFPWTKQGDVMRLGAYYYLEIGMPNESARWAYEYMVLKGGTSSVFELLIQSEIANGNRAQAEKYNQRLLQMPFYKERARRYQKQIEKLDRRIVKEPRNEVTDFFVLTDRPDAMIDSVLQVQPYHKGALQYKMASLMLQRNLKGVARLLPQFETAGFTTMPQNVAEAMTTYQLMKVGPVPILKEMTQASNLETDFTKFLSTWKSYARNKPLGFKRMEKKYGATYWYYVLRSSAKRR